jgi:hypothetical protein
MHHSLWILVLLGCIGCGGAADNKKKAATPEKSAAGAETPPQAAAPVSPIRMPDAEKAIHDDKVVAQTDPSKPRVDTTRKKVYQFPQLKPEAAGPAVIEPTGYITSDGVKMYAAPKQGNEGIALKKYENIKVIETRMTDESGQTKEVPQWYKVRRENKKTGWVPARYITLN